jgi:hypothetical protein
MADLMGYAPRLAGEIGDRGLPPVEQWTPAPYSVRSGRSALIARPVFYDLVGLGETREVEGEAIERFPTKWNPVGREKTRQKI